MFGGGVMSTLCYYKSWELVGSNEFPAVHRSVSDRIIPYFVPVIVLLVPLNILLIWLHPPAISRWLIIVTAAMHTLIVVVRLTVFLPIQKQLDKAKSMELIKRLHAYDQLFGSGIPASIKMLATIAMLYQVVNASVH
jgi:hypothetical protein